MSFIYNQIPANVPKVDSKFRRIVTYLPVPESIKIINDSQKHEPISVQGQPPIIWDRAKGVQVYDPYGNMWLDFSSGVLVANAGHGCRKACEAAIEEINKPNLFSYCFPNQQRIRLAKELVELMPDGLDKIFFLTTGSEATENGIKLARTYGEKDGNREKKIIVTFQLGFHGRTLGSQQAGGYPEAKSWIGWYDPGFIQVPFPDGFHCENTEFDLFERSLHEQGVDFKSVAGVMIETYQGGGASFAPKKYIQSLAEWCKQYDSLLIFDEVQAGFGRTGKMFGFEHYEVVPDLVCLGKGISGSLPLSAVVGRNDILDQYGPGSMTSTHGGHPVSCAAALAHLDTLISENLVDKAAITGNYLKKKLRLIGHKYSDVIGAIHGKGLVCGIHIVKPGNKEADGKFAFDITELCFQQGLLMFAPVGYGGATLKICPPLCITQEQVDDGIEVLDKSFSKILRR